MKIIKLLWIVIGSVFLALGVIGIFLPVLPTTPFLLITLFCYTKGSERIKHWFIKTELYKNHLQEFQEKKGMPLKSKIMILTFASSMLILAFYFCHNIHARILIIVVIIVKYYVFIFRIKTLPPKEKDSVNEAIEK